MKRIVLGLLGLLFLVGGGAAYQVMIEAPETLSVGKPLIVNGTSTFGIGTPIDVVLYRQLTTSTEVKRKIAYIQADKTFRVVFDTTNLPKGLYKVEVPANGLGDSITMRLVTLVDRSDEIQLSSSTVQAYTGKLSIAGIIKGDENAGVQIEVTGPDGSTIFGPQYINTNYQGGFTAEVPVTAGGDFEVSFTDARGFIGTRYFRVVQEAVATAVPTDLATRLPLLSAHAPSSRDSPAYFILLPGSAAVNVTTSSTMDWVIEYIDEQGVLHTVNGRGKQKPEILLVQGKGKPLYFRVYPNNTGESGVAFLYAENANSLIVSQNIPSVFAALNTPAPTETRKSPVAPVIAMFGAAGAVLLFSRRLS